MRLTLVDNFIMPERLDPELFDVHPHLGLASLAAVVQPEGHQIAIYDPKREVRFGRRQYDASFYDAAAADILATKPEAVGFTTLGCSFLFAVRVAERIKRQEPEMPVLLGGPHATMLDRRILEVYDQFDVVVRHEAEQTLLPVLAALETRCFDFIPGVTWRSRTGGQIRSTPGLPKIEDLDSLPIPLYDLYPIPELDLDLLRVEAGRGCPFSCTFCSTASFFQRSYRLKSPERLVREMDLLHARYGATEFKLDHDLFTVDRRKVRAFCEAVQDRNYRWRVSARTDCVDEELLESMALAGCIGLYFGIETGSQRMQRISEKRLHLEGVERTLALTESFGIESTVSFITGYPEETRADQDATLDMLGEAFRGPEAWCLPQLHILLPEPGTPMFERHAHKLAYDGYVTPYNAKLLREDDRDHILRHPDVYATYHYYPAAMDREEYTFAVDAVDAVREAGHETLSYGLLFFGGTLSRFLAEFKQWVRQKRPGARISPELVVEFIAGTVGPGHHLTSLFRFGMAIRERRASAALPNPTDLDGPGGVLHRLSGDVRILADLHDCTSLLAQIRRLPRGAPPLDDRNTGARACHLAILKDGTAAHYRLEAGAEAILSLFETPQSIGEVTALLRGMDPGGADQSGFFQELVKIGALVPATAACPQAAVL
jgi:radical SAM superfamily enzyme YgiQ (UPF0313 family)